jgi:succinate-semialdehyde dehydrogenase/glutarate-semialdehyde dehydrogenase
MSEREQTTCKNPATGEVIGYSPLDAVEDVAAVVSRSREAQRGWAATPFKERARAVLRIRDYIAENADDLAETISRDNGKTRTDALATEVLPSIMAADYYAKNADRFLAERMLKPGNPLLANKIAKIVRVPFGVIGIISPWNYPFAIPFSEIVMGLLAGNGVVLKVATETQLVGRALERAVRAGGLPSDLFAHVNVPGRLAGDAFLQGGVDKLFFTGSVPVGKKLMAKAAETLTPVSLELGGNDAMLVCPDADLERAAAGAVWAGFQNAGQSCGGVERIYVHRDVYDTFLEKLGERVRALRVGPDLDFEVDMGAITTVSQLRTVQRHVEEALEKGATVFAKSSCPEGGEGTFHPAMVLTDVNHDMLVMREETFGPLVGVMKVDTMEEAVELANDSNLGLTGSVWSADRKEAERLGRKIRAGAIMINDHLMSHGLAETPWGGFKESGIGRTHGEIGFAEMTEPQCIVQDYMPAVRKNMWWHPHGKGVYDGVRGIIDLLYAREAGLKVTGAGRLAKLFPRTFTNGG